MLWVDFFLQSPPLNPVNDIVINPFLLANFIAFMTFNDFPEELITIKISFFFALYLI